MSTTQDLHYTERAYMPNTLVKKDMRADLEPVVLPADDVLLPPECGRGPRPHSAPRSTPSSTLAQYRPLPAPTPHMHMHNQLPGRPRAVDWKVASNGRNGDLPFLRMVEWRSPISPPASPPFRFRRRTWLLVLAVLKLCLGVGDGVRVLERAVCGLGLLGGGGAAAPDVVVQHLEALNRLLQADNHTEKQGPIESASITGISLRAGARGHKIASRKRWCRSWL